MTGPPLGVPAPCSRFALRRGRLCLRLGRLAFARLALGRLAFGGRQARSLRFLRGLGCSLGSQPCVLSPGFAREAYGTDRVEERHRHRYEFNNDYREQLAEAGMAFTGIGADKDLVEIIEIPDHPWFVAVQFHPEFLSKPTRAHPLFREFLRAAMARAGFPTDRRVAAATRQERATGNG